jgi:hypothetical protein
MKMPNKMSIARSTGALSIMIWFIAMNWGCGNINLTGGGSDTEVTGRILAASGEGTRGAIVALIDTGYDPGFDGPLASSMFDTTDNQGRYHFDSLSEGIYNVWAFSPDDSTQALIHNISVIPEKETPVSDHVLSATAHLKILLPDSLSARTGRISVPGTMLSVATTGVNSIVEVPGVPQGILPSIRFRETPSDKPVILYTHISITSAATVTLNSYNEVYGVIFESLQTVAGAVVSLIPADYNPAFGGDLPVKLSGTTGTDGVYHFYNIDQGSYTLFAAKGSKIIYPGVNIDSRKSIAFADIALKKTATLKVSLPDSLQSGSGYVYMPGTFSVVRSAPGATDVLFDSLAQGTYSRIVYQRSAADPAIVLFKNVVIDSAGLFVLDPYMNWRHEARVILNTTAGGANIGERLNNIPVLIRLTATEMDFSQARPEGEDLRFVRPNNSLMVFEIEYWDSATATAAVWLRIDTVQANAVTAVGRMLWGNPDAKKTSQPKIVFDTADGFAGVWHLGESGPNEKRDATANGFFATPVELTGSSDVAGVAGRALDVDGSSQCVSVLNARNTRLDVQADSFYTVSAWVYLRNAQLDNRVIVSKGSAQFGLMANEQNQWEFYGGLRGYGVDTTTTSAATVNVWTHLTGVRKGKRQYLYVNGHIADSTASAAGTSASLSNNYYDLVIGRQSDDESQWFDGLIDEVRVENRARSDTWVRLCYENQRIGQQFIQIQKVQ